MRIRLSGSWVLAAVAAVTPLFAQAPPPPPGQQPMPGMPSDRPPDQQLPLPGQTQSFKPVVVAPSIGGRDVNAMPAFRESSVEISVSGTAGFSVALRSLPNITFPGNQPLSGLMQLIDAPPATSVSPPNVAANSSSQPQIVGPVRDSRLPTELPTLQSETAPAPRVTVRKLLVFRGLNRSVVSNADNFFRTFDIDIEATRVAGAAPVVRRFTIVLSNDDAAPAIVALNSEASGASNSAGGDDFPPVVQPTGQEAELYATKTYKLNWVKLHRKVTVIATDFSVDGDRPSTDFKRFYKIVTEYEDGTRYEYPYEHLGPYTTVAGARRLQFYVPNIGRGAFRVLLRSAFGESAKSQSISLPANTFVTSLPIATGPVVAINVDSPLNVGGFEALLGVAPGTFQYTVLPAQPQCGSAGSPDEYARWDSVSMGNVEVFPVGLASAKFSSTPAVGSIVHSGNMPRIVGTSAGLGTIRAHWVARMKVFVADCPSLRLPN